MAGNPASPPSFFKLHISRNRPSPDEGDVPLFCLNESMGSMGCPCSCPYHEPREFSYYHAIPGETTQSEDYPVGVAKFPSGSPQNCAHRSIYTAKRKPLGPKHDTRDTHHPTRRTRINLRCVRRCTCG